MAAIPCPRTPLVISTFIALGGCASAPPRQSDAMRHAGNSTYEALPTAADRRYTLEPGDAVEQPAPIDNPAPDYPSALVPLSLASVHLDVRVVVDASGAVSECLSLAPADAFIPHAQEFLEAVRAATTHWRFKPLRVRKTIDVDENGDGEVDSVRQGEPQSLPFSLDYRFHFAVIDGKGQVQLDRRDAAH